MQRLLAADFPGKEEIAKQLAGCRVRDIDDEGSLENLGTENLENLGTDGSWKIWGQEAVKKLSLDPTMSLRN
ncbi:MAG TPA: hypothetical protein VI386_01725 [Candidatus Sulfotelmatobacter sp.]